MLGICLGFENFAIYTSDLGEDVLESFPQHFESVPIKFTQKSKLSSSIMYQDLNEKDIYDYEHMNLVYMAHDFAVSPERFATDK